METPSLAAALESRLRRGRIALDGEDPLPGATGADRVAVLLAAAELARKFAQPRLSGYAAGAAVVGPDGSIYLGANQEFSRLELGQTIHAEQAAVCIAASHGANGIEAIATSASPCGHCRQFLWEADPTGRLEVLLPGRPPRPLAELLPAAFGPTELGQPGGSLAHGFSSESHPEGAAATGEAELEARAVEAAGRSYAPYTGSRAGVALRLAAGDIVTGCTVENAAFNPTLSPLQVAAARHAFSPGPVVAAVLAAAHDAAVDFAPGGRALLRVLAPEVTLRTIALPTPPGER